MSKVREKERDAARGPEWHAAKKVKRRAHVAKSRAKNRASEAQKKAHEQTRWIRQRAKRDAALRAREQMPLDGAAWAQYEARLAAHAAGMADFLRGKR
jgi:hypothetical protein